MVVLGGGVFYERGTPVPLYRGTSLTTKNLILGPYMEQQEDAQGPMVVLGGGRGL